MKRVLVTLTFATLAGALVFGAAASLEVGANDLGSGSSVVAACDSDGVSIDYTLTPGDPTTVDAVVVSGIDSTCDGQTAYLGVFDGSNVDLFDGTDNQAYTDASHLGELTFTATTPMQASAIVGVAVTITGAPVAATP